MQHIFLNLYPFTKRYENIKAASVIFANNKAANEKWNDT